MSEKTHTNKCVFPKNKIDDDDDNDGGGGDDDGERTRITARHFQK